MTGAAGRATGSDHRPIAPAWHTAALIALFAGLATLGWAARFAARPSIPAPTRLVSLQIGATIFEWGCVGWVWFGLRLNGFRLRDLIAERWTRPSAALGDGLLGATTCAALLAVTLATNFIFRRDGSLEAIPFPAGPLEVSLAILVALSAGVCEELVFRGYLQRQFRALSGSAGVAVLLQALVFGPGHFYQGVRVTSLATLYGLVFGFLALRRGSLRPGMVAHTLTDLVARVLRVG